MVTQLHISAYRACTSMYLAYYSVDIIGNEAVTHDAVQVHEGS